MKKKRHRKISIFSVIGVNEYVYIYIYLLLGKVRGGKTDEHCRMDTKTEPEKVTSFRATQDIQVIGVYLSCTVYRTERNELVGFIHKMERLVTWFEWLSLCNCVKCYTT